MAQTQLHGIKLTCCPLSLGNIGTPSLPVGGALAVLLEALFLFAEVFLILNENHCDCRSRCKWASESLLGRKSGGVDGARSGVEIIIACRQYGANNGVVRQPRCYFERDSGEGRIVRRQAVWKRKSDSEGNGSIRTTTDDAGIGQAGVVELALANRGRARIRDTKYIIGIRALRRDLSRTAGLCPLKFNVFARPVSRPCR